MVKGEGTEALRHNGIEREEVLMMRRPMGGVWEGMWEFPVVAGEEKRWPESHRGTRRGRTESCEAGDPEDNRI